MGPNSQAQIQRAQAMKVMKGKAWMRTARPAQTGSCMTFKWGSHNKVGMSSVYCRNLSIWKPGHVHVGARVCAVLP